MFLDVNVNFPRQSGGLAASIDRLHWVLVGRYGWLRLVPEARMLTCS